MARIRSIKPEFWTSEQVMECSPTARLLFIGMWNFCDDEGRMPLSPKQIKALILPGDDIAVDSIRGMIDELSANGLVNPYTVDGKEFLEVTGWHHQKIDRPQKPKYPAPLDALSGNSRDHSSNGIDGEDKGKDQGRDQGKEGSESRARASSSLGESTLFPDMAFLDDQFAADAREIGVRPENVEREFSRFRDHAEANGRRCADWRAAWRLWCGNARDLNPGGAGQTDAVAGISQVFIDKDDPRWSFLAAAYQRDRGRPPPIINNGWYFPEEWSFEGQAA